MYSSKRPLVSLDLARVEKGEVISDNKAPKPTYYFLSRTTIGTRGPTVETRKIASRRVSSLAS